MAAFIMNWCSGQIQMLTQFRSLRISFVCLAEWSETSFSQPANPLTNTAPFSHHTLSVKTLQFQSLIMNQKWSSGYFMQKKCPQIEPSWSLGLSLWVVSCFALRSLIVRSLLADWAPERFLGWRRACRSHLWAAHNWLNTSMYASVHCIYKSYAKTGTQGCDLHKYSSCLEYSCFKQIFVQVCAAFSLSKNMLGGGREERNLSV